MSPAGRTPTATSVNGDNLGSDQPICFARLGRAHDGWLDIANGSGLGTVPSNRLHVHDKTMLIGSGGSRIPDTGKHAAGPLRLHPVADRDPATAGRV